MSMDPERLATLEAIVSGMGVGHQESNELVEELLAERHDLVREAERVKAAAQSKIFELGEPATFARAERLRGERDTVMCDLCRAWAENPEGGSDDPREHAKEQGWDHLVFDEFEADASGWKAISENAEPPLTRAYLKRVSDERDDAMRVASALLREIGWGDDEAEAAWMLWGLTAAQRIYGASKLAWVAKQQPGAGGDMRYLYGGKTLAPEGEQPSDETADPVEIAYRDADEYMGTNND